MTATALIAEARAAGIRMTVRGDRLRIEAKPGAVSADMRARLAAGKPEIVEALRQGEAEQRAHLLALAESEGVDAAHVHRLHADDVTACAGESDNTLRAYVRALERDAGMDAGIVPADWQAVAHCAGCGPVHLWEPLHVIACPWCFRRKAGKRVPRPMVTCGDCRHYLPDPLNREAGMGGCGLGPGRARWPMQRHRCADMAPANRPEQDAQS